MTDPENQTVQTRGKESTYTFIDIYEMHVPASRLSFRPPPDKIISLTSQLQKKVIVNIATFLEADDFPLQMAHIKGADKKHLTALGSSTEKTLAIPHVKQLPKVNRSHLLLASTHPAACQWG